MISFPGASDGRHLFRVVTFAALPALLASCATMPSSGPTRGQIEKSARPGASAAGAIRIVEIEDFASLPASSVQPRVFSPDNPGPPTDLVGPGDLLDISIYETGVTLFGPAAAKSAIAAASADPAVQVERLPALRVDDEGYIRLPYVGRIRAGGNTGPELESKIRTAYRGMSQNPQVIVSIRDSVTNSVIVGGEVLKPGRLVLQTNRQTLSDIVALAGGYRGETKDMAVRVQRQNMNAEYRLGDVLSNPADDVRIYPGDRISVVRVPRTFSVMGAPGRVEQVAFGTASVSLAEALATSGGANPAIGDPAAIFVFRYVRNPDTGVEEPVVYHVDMMKAGSYFIAQRFAMRDKDVLYVGNAAANQPMKLVQIVSQLFAPIVTIQNIAQTTGN